MAILDKEKWKIDSRNEKKNRKEGEKKTIFFSKKQEIFRFEFLTLKL